MKTLTITVFIALALSSWYGTVEAAKPVCLFLHGLGQDGPSGDEPCQYKPTSLSANDNCKSLALIRMKKYWGKLIEGVLEQDLCTPVFHFAGTNHHSWDSEELTASYCLAVEKSDARIVFTHSMANLILAAGIYYQMSGCERFIRPVPDDSEGWFDFSKGKVPAGKTVWFGAQGPLSGSPGAPMCLQLCSESVYKSGDSGDKKGSLFKRMQLTRGQKACGCGEGSPYRPKPFPGTVSLAPDYVGTRSKKDLAGGRSTIQISDESCAAVTQKDGKAMKCVTVTHVADQFMWGNICGISRKSLSGVISKNDLKYMVVARKIREMNNGAGWGVDGRTDLINGFGNDGVVQYNSCVGRKKSQFKFSAVSHFYTLVGNHKDGTGQNGDNPKRKIVVRPVTQVKDCSTALLNDDSSADVPLVQLEELDSDYDYVELQDFDREEDAATQAPTADILDRVNADLMPITWYTAMIDEIVRNLAAPTSEADADGDWEESFDLFVAERNAASKKAAPSSLASKNRARRTVSILTDQATCDAKPKQQDKLGFFKRRKARKTAEKGQEQQSLIPKSEPTKGGKK